MIYLSLEQILSKGFSLVNVWHLYCNCAYLLEIVFSSMVLCWRRDKRDKRRGEKDVRRREAKRLEKRKRGLEKRKSQRMEGR